MSEQTILCRCSISGRFNTFREGEIEALYVQLCREGLARFLFSDRSIYSPQSFYDSVTHRQVWFYAIYDAVDKPFAVAIFDQFKGTTAHIHTAFFRAGRPHAISIAQRFLDLVFANGLSALFGLTSRRFQHAYMFAKKVGFQELGSVPGYHAWFNERKQRMEYHEAFLGLCTPASLQAALAKIKETDSPR